jgi:hypothetical protein
LESCLTFSKFCKDLHTAMAFPREGTSNLRKAGSVPRADVLQARVTFRYARYVLTARVTFRYARYVLTETFC